ncbi:MAG: pilus assembly protein PilM [Deltaproteobacteria bacterium]|nr:pilus assembly protein PilM [Deltaproteobacteria bacterium]
MARRILGIDIQTDSIAAVQVECGLRGYHVTGCASVMMEDVDGLDEALKALREQVDFKADTYISAIPGEQVSYRNLQMPFRSTKKIRQTIAYEIETMVPFPVEDLVVDFTLIDQSGQNDVLAASVRREDISKYLAVLQNHGVEPDILDISGVPVVLWLFRQLEIPDDGILFQIGQKRTTMVLYIDKHISLIRSLAFSDGLMPEAISNSPAYGNAQSQLPKPIVSCFELLCTNVQNTLHAFEYQNDIEVKPEKIFVTGAGNLYPHTVGLLERFFDIPVEEINVLGGDPGIHIDENIAQSWNSATMDSALALTLRGNKQGLGFNFRKDEFQIKRKNTKLKREIRKDAVFLIVILSLLATYFGMDYYFLKERYRMLNKQITETFRQTLPNVKRIVDPLQQMRIEITQIKKSAFFLPGIGGDHKVVDLLRDISIRVPESLDVRVMRMVVDPAAVNIKGETDTFNTVDIIKKGLEPSEYFSSVTISSANLDRSRRRVQFEIKLKRAK